MHSIESMEKDILHFLIRYRSLSVETRALIAKAGILDDIKAEFVFRMSEIEGIGIGTLIETKNIIQKGGDAEFSTTEKITFNITRALDMKHQAVTKAQLEQNGLFLVSCDIAN